MFNKKIWNVQRENYFSLRSMFQLRSFPKTSLSPAEMDVSLISAICIKKLAFQPKECQLEAWKILLWKEKDLVVSLPVGYGKSAIYQLFPMLYEELFGKSAISLVISPLNIIQNDQLSGLKKRSIPACRIDMEGNIHCNQCEDRCCCEIEKVADGAFSVIFCHPESLFSSEKGAQLIRNAEFQLAVKCICIDECHVYDKWHTEFRQDFKKIKDLPAMFMEAKMMAMSGTLTASQLESLPEKLGLKDKQVISTSPDRTNIFLEKFIKTKSSDILHIYEDVFKDECLQLQSNPQLYPVTLLYIPMFYMSFALMFLKSLFGEQDISESYYSAIFANQDNEVITSTLQELNKECPRIRLILSTSVSGMGFDPPTVTRVIHACPPRSISQYLQEIGRAGRRSQPASATLYYNQRDIAANLPGMNNDIRSYCKNEGCLRECLLSFYDFKPDGSLSGCRCCCYCKERCKCEICNDDFDLTVSNLKL